MIHMSIVLLDSLVEFICEVGVAVVCHCSVFLAFLRLCPYFTKIERDSDVARFTLVNVACQFLVINIFTLSISLMR